MSGFGTLRPTQWPASAPNWMLCDHRDEPRGCFSRTAELEKKIAQRGAQLTQRLREMEAVKEAEAKGTSDWKRITSCGRNLCQTTDSLGRLHAAERFQRRVDQASDTESP